MEIKWRTVWFRMRNQEARVANTDEVMVARVLGVNPLGPLGRRLVKRAMSRM